MFDKLKQSWHKFRSGESGHRFQKRYYEGLSAGRGPLRKIIALVIGSLVIAIGIFFMPAPGPGLLIVFIGAGMVAEESLPAARALDWAELKLRGVCLPVSRTWHRITSPTLKALMVVALLILLVAAAFGVYKFVYPAFLGTGE